MPVDAETQRCSLTTVGGTDRLEGRVEPERSYDDDLLFGLVTLSGVASRALSPAINDPGTAIEVLGAGLRVLLAYGRGLGEAELDAVARTLNSRPRKTLGWATPAEAIEQLLSSPAATGVATTP